MKRISVLVVLAVGLAFGVAGCGGTDSNPTVPIIPQVTVTVLQGFPAVPLTNSPVVEATGDDGKSPPSPTGVIETKNTDGSGKVTFTLPASVPGGWLCFSSKIVYSGSGTGYSFVQHCRTVNDLQAQVTLEHLF